MYHNAVILNREEAGDDIDFNVSINYYMHKSGEIQVHILLCLNVWRLFRRHVNYTWASHVDIVSGK